MPYSMQTLAQVEAWCARITEDPGAPPAHLPLPVRDLLQRVLDIEPRRLAALDAYLEQETPLTRQAWIETSEAAGELKALLAAAYNGWMSTQDPAARCPGCGYYSTCGQLCAACRAGTSVPLAVNWTA